MGIVLTQIEDDVVWYTPDIGDNRKKPLAEQCRVLLAPLSLADLRRAEREASTPTAGFSEYLNRLREDVLRKSVKRIEGLRMRHVKNGTETFEDITKVERLIELGVESVLQDLYSGIVDHSRLEEGLLGKSASQSDSSGPQSQKPGPGAARGAEEETTPSRTECATGEDVSGTHPHSMSTSPQSSNAAHGVS